MQEKNLISQIVLEKVYFEESCDPIGQKHFFDLTRKLDFSRICSFRRIIVTITVHYSKPKDLHIDGLKFLAKSKKSYFGGFLGGGLSPK